MKKQYSVILISTFFMVLFFQNCGKALNVGDSLDTGIASPNQQYNKYSVEGFKTLSVWDYLKTRFLDVDLASGQVTAFEEGGQTTGESFQLPSEKLKELKSILDQAEICEPVINAQDLQGRLCTMAYHYPYAILMDQGDEVRLGEKTDGCAIPVDLCGERAKHLQSWSKSMVESL